MKLVWCVAFVYMAAICIGDGDPMPPEGGYFGGGCDTIYIGYKPRKNNSPPKGGRETTIQKGVY